MHIAPTFKAPNFESVVAAQRSNFLQTLSNAAQASERRIQSSGVRHFSDTAQNLHSLNTGAASTSGAVRGQSLDIWV
jgi:hypothetical protein